MASYSQQNRPPWWFVNYTNGLAGGFICWPSLVPFFQLLRHPVGSFGPSGLSLQEHRGSRTCQSSDQGALVEQCMMAISGKGSSRTHSDRTWGCIPFSAIGNWWITHVRSCCLPHLRLLQYGYHMLLPLTNWVCTSIQVKTVHPEI